MARGCPVSVAPGQTFMDPVACKICGCHQRERFVCSCGQVDEPACSCCLNGGGQCDRGLEPHQHHAKPPIRRRRRGYEFTTWPA